MTITVRQIRKFDPGLLKEIINRGHGSLVPNRKFFSDRKNILLVAFHDNKLAGFLWGFLLIHPDRPRPALFLYSVEVWESFRQRGIATLLVEKLKAKARKLQCSEIFVFTNETNMPAMKLYSKTGGIRETMNDVMFVYSFR